MAGWYVARDGQVVGPFTLGQLAAQVRQGELLPDELVCAGGTDSWRLAGSVDALFGERRAVPEFSDPRPAQKQSPRVEMPSGASALVQVGVVGGALMLTLLTLIAARMTVEVPEEYSSSWLSFLLLILAGFVPAVSAPTMVTRLVSALLAALCGVALAGLSALAWSPNAGMAAMLFGLAAVPFAAGCLVLLSVGLAWGLSRIVDRVTHDRHSWYLVPVLTVMIIALLVGVPFAGRRIEERNYYATSARDVEAARDSAQPQTQSELTRRVIELMSSAGISESASTEDHFKAEDAAARRLVDLWHPGPLKNLKVMGTAPGNSRLESEYQRMMYGLGGISTRWDWRGGDSFVAYWRGEISSDDVLDGSSRESLSFYLGESFDGTYRFGERLFPQGRFHQLDVHFVRDGAEEPFLTLYAVDDGGKWWLVGAQGAP